MRRTADELWAELSSHRFRWWRWAWVISLPCGALFLVGVVYYFIQGNGQFMEHPLTMITIGIGSLSLGVMLLCQPRTYLEYVRVHHMVRLAEKGLSANETMLRKNFRRDTVLTVLGSLVMLFVGLSLLVGGISKL